MTQATDQIAATFAVYDAQFRLAVQAQAVVATASAHGTIGDAPLADVQAAAAKLNAAIAALQGTGP